MVITDSNRAIARGMFEVALGQVIRFGDAAAAGAAERALLVPTASTIRDLVELGRGQEWLPSVRDALAEVGIAGAEDVLGDLE